MNSKELSEDVLALVQHLKQSGTGKAKLVTIAEVAQKSETPLEFYETLKKCLSFGTMMKVDKFLQDLAVKKAQAEVVTPAPIVEAPVVASVVQGETPGLPPAPSGEPPDDAPVAPVVGETPTEPEKPAEAPVLPPRETREAPAQPKHSDRRHNRR